MGYINTEEDEYFLEYFKLEKGSTISLVLTYYGVTTLTTIGLGDFYPKSNFERIICSVLMVCGVAIFSLTFQNIDQAITKIRLY